MDSQKQGDTLLLLLRLLQFSACDTYKKDVVDNIIAYPSVPGGAEAKPSYALLVQERSSIEHKQDVQSDSSSQEDNNLIKSSDLRN